jgi:phosphoenolpyruvate carboxykinase (ATP)
MHNMLIRPTDQELEQFGEPDFVIYNAGAFPANRYTTGMTSRTSVDLSIERREVVLLGTEYAGEMKKAVFTYMNYILPSRGILSMHCSATCDRQTGQSSVLFGLSGTGKTTLSADPRRFLIGDDEHGWSDTGIFNIEGGCYAKAVYLTRESEPEIFEALRFARFWKTWSTTKPIAMWTSTIQRSLRTRVVPIRLNTCETPAFPVWRVTPRTLSF